MDFEHFLGLCGHSIFPEEYKGDLDAAWNYLQQHRPGSADAEPEALAEYLRCSSIYCILTGRLADAYTHLAGLHDLLDNLPQEWGLRYTNYKVLADFTRRFPPMLRFYHERAKPLNIVMLGDIIGPYEISQSFMSNVGKYLPIGTMRDQGLCQILGAVQWYPMQIRNLSQRFHPLSPGGSRHEPGINLAWAMAEMAKPYLQFREVAEANGALGVALYLSRLIAEFSLACQSPDSAIYLEDLYRRCDRLKDPVGKANCKMMEGDSLCSPSFVPPISLNLIVIDVYSSIGDDAIWEPIENDLKFEYTDEVKQRYVYAMELFRDANCKRGQAAVLLRQACCLHNVARQRRGANQAYLDILAKSDSMLQQSFELFGRDEVNLQIVKTHQVLVSIARGSFQHVKAMAQEIGEWSARTKNETIGHFIGLLMFRFAHQEWFKFSNMDTALLSWECAYAVLKGIDDIIPMFQTVVARAWTQHEMFNSAASQILIQQALAMVDDIRDYFDNKIRNAPNTNLGQADRSILTTSKCHLLWTFSREVSNMYIRIEDLQGFHDWHAKLTRILETDESFREYQEQLQDTKSLGLFKRDIALSDTKAKGLWQKLIAEEAAKVMFGSSNIAFRRLLDEGDVLKAEQTLRQFVDDARQLENVVSRELYSIIACERIGDADKARAILDTITDNELFDGDLEYFQQRIGVRSTFPTVAQAALIFSILGRDLDRGRRIIDIITKISPRYFEEANDSIYEFSYRLSYWGSIMRDIDPKSCLSKLLLARRIIETRRQHTTDLDARMGTSVSGANVEIYMNLARLCISFSRSNISLTVMSEFDHGNFDNISWLEHALLFVEMSRARAVLESLQSQGHGVQGMPSIPRTAPLSEALHKRRLLKSLLALESPTSEQEEEVLQLEEDIQKMKQDETLSTAADFIETVNSTIGPQLLYQSIDENAVVIEATFGPRGFVAFAITRDGIQSTHQGTKSEVDMRRPVMIAMKLMREMKGYIGEDEEKRKNQLRQLSREISEVLVDPFTDTIRAKQHVIFSVSHPLTAFPFAVLILDDKALIEHAAVSQVPSLTVLHYLSQRKTASMAPTISVLAKSPTEDSSDPASTQDGDDQEANLHMAGIEAVNIARLFATWPIEASNLSRGDFRRYIEGESSIMHIGTHGYINVRNPLLSSISIGEGQEFRVGDMASIRSHVNLLVFAACLSGLGKATIGSEVLGFSHVVLSTGCQAYVGSLWKVSDFGSMLIMTLFYQHLKKNPSLSIAECMRAAQIGVLQMNSEKADRFLEDMLQNWASSDRDDQSPAEFVPDAEFLLMTLRMILDQLDWSSPFYWAPFILIGYGGFQFMHDERKQSPITIN